LSTRFRVTLFGNTEEIASEEFEVKIWGTDETNDDCKMATATSSGGATDHSLVFAAGSKYAALNITDALSVWIDGVDDTTKCRPIFTLKVKDPEENDPALQWKSWDELGDTLRLAHPGHHFGSHVYLNDTTAFFTMNMTASDVATVTRFTSGGQTMLEFKISASIPGSDSMGATALETDLVTNYFFIKILDESAAQACANNSPVSSDYRYGQD
jgi:hypothetical protein